MLSQRIRELRVAQGYSQVTLAKRLGCLLYTSDAADE